MSRYEPNYEKSRSHKKKMLMKSLGEQDVQVCVDKQR
jgi:hypothetical protein